MTRFVVSVVLVLLTASNGIGAPATLRAYDPPKAAPAFSFEDITGVVHTNADYRGQILLVHFWATWCIPCRQEMPSLVELSRRLQTNGVATIAVAVKEDHAAVRSFVAKNGIPFPVTVDPTDRSMTPWAAIGVPSTIVLDKKGMIRFRVTGQADWNGPGMTAMIGKLTTE